MPQFITVKSAQGLRLNADEIRAYYPEEDNKTKVIMKNGQIVVYNQSAEEFDAMLAQERTVREFSRALQKFIRDFTAAIGRIPTSIRMHY